MNWFIYLLRCEDNSLYCGITTDPAHRFQQHSGKLRGGAKYTRQHTPVRFEQIWQTAEKGSALRFEHRIKKLTHFQKEALLLGPIPELDETGYLRNF